MTASRFHLRLLVTAMLATPLLGGCAMNAVRNQTSAGSSAATASADAYLQRAKDQSSNAQAQLPVVADVPYVSVQPVTGYTAYPPSFDREVHVHQRGPASVATLLDAVSANGAPGTRVTAAPDVMDSDGDAGGAAKPAAHGGGDSTTGALADLAPLLTGGGNLGSLRVLAPVNYDGTFKGLLDAVATQLQATWSYNHDTNEVRFFRYETKVFSLATAPTDATAQASLGGSNSGITGQTGQTIKAAPTGGNTSFDGKLSVWSSVGDAIKTMLSPNGKVTLSPATGTIVVRDRYDRVTQIADYISQINARLQLSVAINVTVYRINLNNQDSHGADWSVLYNTLGRMANRMSLSISTAGMAPGTQIQGANSAIIGAPSVNEEGRPSLWGGSKAMLQALSTLGNATVVQHLTLLTTNNQPAPVHVVTDTGYLAETTPVISNGVTGNGVVGSGSSLMPGNVETGFTMQILPSVQPDGHHILMQLSVGDSTLDAMNSQSSGGNTIQTPDITRRATLQRAWINSGETLVLAGFETNSDSNTTSTLFGRHTWGFGGQRSLQHQHQALVVVITPVVTDTTSNSSASNAAAL